jgi:hypothetical protein
LLRELHLAFRIDKTESHPSIELLDLTGTPITGNGDIEHSGKCAAPPASNNYCNATVVCIFAKIK